MSIIPPIVPQAVTPQGVEQDTQPLLPLGLAACRKQ